MNKQQEQILKSGVAINKAGRPAGSKNKRTIIREALEQSFDDGEHGFWLAVCAQAKAGDLQAAAMLADRLYPKLKPLSDPVRLSESLQGSPGDIARQIMTMTSKGEISTDTAKELLSALTDVCKIIEITELEKRLNTLEKLYNEQ